MIRQLRQPRCIAGRSPDPHAIFKQHLRKLSAKPRARSRYESVRVLVGNRLAHALSGQGCESGSVRAITMCRRLAQPIREIPLRCSHILEHQRHIGAAKSTAVLKNDPGSNRLCLLQNPKAVAGWIKLGDVS